MKTRDNRLKVLAISTRAAAKLIEDSGYSDVRDTLIEIADQLDAAAEGAAGEGPSDNPDYAPLSSAAFDVACDVVERLKMYPAPEWGRGRNAQVTLDWSAINLTVEVFSRETVRYAWTESEDAGTSGGGYWETAAANIGAILSRKMGAHDGESDDTAALDFLDAFIADHADKRICLTDGTGVIYIETYGAVDVRSILAAAMREAAGAANG